MPRSVGQVKAKAENLLGVYKRAAANLNDYDDNQIPKSSRDLNHKLEKALKLGHKENIKQIEKELVYDS